MKCCGSRSLLIFYQFFISWIDFVVTSNIITDKVFKDNVNGIISAFGDFNADKLTDVFFITNEGRTVEVYLAQEKEPILMKSEIRCSFSDYDVTSVVPGDFNGDSKMDVLVTLKEAKSQDHFNRTVVFKILWGNLNNLSGCSIRPGDKELLHHQLKDQPLILDYDADKIPDVYGELLNGTRQVWLMKENKTYVTKEIKSSNPIRQPHSNAFLNLDEDSAADIFITAEINIFEIWYNKDGYFNDMEQVKFDVPNVKILGQSAFMDVDLDGKLDHVVPVCFDEQCTNSSFYIYVNMKWLPLAVSLKNGASLWGFMNTISQPITLRIGDYNLDGYPDILVVMKNIGGSSPKNQKAVLFENSPCDECLFCRQFKPKWNFPGLADINNVTHAAFYDIYQDGNLDFLLVSQMSDQKEQWKISAVQNMVTSDVCFIKVLVLSGLCYRDCPEAYKPYGVNQPGPFVKYDTTGPDGSEQSSCAAQLSQSAYSALQLPYTVLGLGQTPNFVDTLTVGIPQSVNGEQNNHTWNSIIPNSQMIVIPLPQGNGYRWLNKLFVTPSHQVLITFIALIGTCCLIIIIIGGLYWKEKIADRKEKLQEAHRFHFDAM